jgi:hypothetical protein
MRIEDRMSMWAAKKPREEVSELLLEGAQEIADLRRAGASITDDERACLESAALGFELDDDDDDCAHIAATIRSLLARLP